MIKKKLINNSLIKKIKPEEKMNEFSSINLYLIGIIDSEMEEKIITKLLESKNLDTLEVINMYISSEGGELYSCFAMIDLITHLKNVLGLKINTFGMGEVCSGGFFMFILGDNRTLFPKCRIFVHEHMSQGDSDLPYSEKMTEFKEERILNKIYIDYVAERLEISSFNAKKFLQKNKWLSIKEIDEYNITNREII